MTGAELLIAALVNEGVRAIVGVPGAETIELVDAIGHSSIEFIVTRHGETAARTAAAHGRMTGQAGVCLACDPGALAMMTGLAHALLGGFPMVVITGQAAAIELRRAGLERDVLGPLEALIKSSRRIDSPRSIPMLVRDAFRTAEAERPGPVHIELPRDIAGEGTGHLPLLARAKTAEPVASFPTIAEATALVMKADAPLVMLGSGANRPHLGYPLAGFFGRLGLPFFATPGGKGAVPCSSNLYLGTCVLHERDYVHRAIDAADLVITIGYDPADEPPFVVGPNGPKLVSIAAAPLSLDEDFLPAAEVVGEVGASLRALADILEGRLSRAGALLRLRADVLDPIAARADEARFPLTPQRIVRDVRAAMPPDGIVCLDAGMSALWFARNYRTSMPGTLILGDGPAAMGDGLPAAMAAAMLHPERRVLAVCGDGGFLASAHDLVTAVRLGLNLVVLVVLDDGYGMIRWRQAVEGFSAFGVDFANPDFEALAAAHGAAGAMVASAGELSPSLQAAFAEGGVHVIVVPADYSENMTVLVDELSRDANGHRR